MKIIADPVAWAWLALVMVSGVLLAKGRKKIGWSLLGLAFIASILEVTSVPARMLTSLERPYLSTAATELSTDAVLVLGGFGKPFPGSSCGVELNDSADRLFTGLALVREGRGRVLILSGGGSLVQLSAISHQPSANYKSSTNNQTESSASKTWIDDWKLSPVPVHTLGACLNTRDEALRMARMAQTNGWKKLILVTSAWHLRRAVPTFRKAGLDVIPVGSDFQGSAELLNNTRLHFIPRTSSLIFFKLWVEETLGYAYYKLRGWA